MCQYVDRREFDMGMFGMTTDGIREAATRQDARDGHDFLALATSVLSDLQEELLSVESALKSGGVTIDARGVMLNTLERIRQQANVAKYAISEGRTMAEPGVRA